MNEQYTHNKTNMLRVNDLRYRVRSKTLMVSDLNFKIMRNTNTTRMPKKDYFMMRYNDAVKNGLHSKAEYYRGRLEQMGVGFLATKFIDKWKENTAGMSEAELLAECVRFFEFGIGKGETINNLVSLLGRCGVANEMILQAVSVV